MKKVKLEEVSEIYGGYAFKSKDFGVGENFVVKIKDIKPPIIDIENADKVDVTKYSIKKMEKYKVFPDDIVIAMTGATIGKVGRNKSGRILYLNQRVAKINPNIKEDLDFIYYCISNNIFLEYVLNNLDSNSAQGNISHFGIGNFEINWYDRETRQKIAQILSCLDDKIEILHQINDNLAELAKTIYDYWFMQFDFPDENGKPYKTSGGKMVYNEVLKREIPEGWEVKRIEDYCKSSGGYAFKSSEWKKSGNPIIKIKNIQENNSLNIEDIDFVDMSKTIDEKFKANAGDVVIAMTGATIGKFAIVPKTDNGFYVNQRVGIFKLNEFKKLPFLINTLNQDYFRKNIIEISCGAAQPNISNEQINNIELILPISNIVEKFNSRMTICYEKIIQNRYKVYHLQSLRDWLLPMLMNGQISVE
jgi:putative type I restriction enzyme S protein|nr:restriction endonuclease subunit S [uncultured Capnocytophaga sp.]